VAPLTGGRGRLDAQILGGKALLSLPTRHAEKGKPKGLPLKRMERYKLGRRFSPKGAIWEQKSGISHRLGKGACARVKGEKKE